MIEFFQFLFCEPVISVQNSHVIPLYFVNTKGGYSHHRCISFLQFFCQIFYQHEVFARYSLPSPPQKKNIYIYIHRLNAVIGFKFKPTFIYAFFWHHTSPLLNATGAVTEEERTSASGKPRRVAETLLRSKSTTTNGPRLLATIFQRPPEEPVRELEK